MYIIIIERCGARSNGDCTVTAMSLGLLTGDWCLGFCVPISKDRSNTLFKVPPLVVPPRTAGSVWPSIRYDHEYRKSP